MSARRRAYPLILTYPGVASLIPREMPGLNQRAPLSSQPIPQQGCDKGIPGREIWAEEALVAAVPRPATAISPLL
jgi:hypothetical protein